MGGEIRVFAEIRRRCDKLDWVSTNFHGGHFHPWLSDFNVWVKLSRLVSWALSIVKSLKELNEIKQVGDSFL